MPLQEPFATKAKQIGHRLIELESASPGLVRMRATHDPFVLTAVVERLKAIGFRKRFFQTPHQFVYDSFLSYQAAAYTCLPYTILAGPPNSEGHTHCWAGVGVYMGWCGPLAMNNFFERKIGGLDGAVLIVNIQPFYDQICDLLDPAAEAAPADGSSFERAIVLEGAILGLAAFVEHEYLNEHYPGYQIQKQMLKEYAGRSFDIVELTTADGKNKTLYFALSEIKRA